LNSVRSCSNFSFRMLSLYPLELFRSARERGMDVEPKRPGSRAGNRFEFMVFTVFLVVLVALEDSLWVVDECDKVLGHNQNYNINIRYVKCLLCGLVLVRTSLVGREKLNNKKTHCKQGFLLSGFKLLIVIECSQR